MSGACIYWIAVTTEVARGMLGSCSDVHLYELSNVTVLCGSWAHRRSGHTCDIMLA